MKINVAYVSASAGDWGGATRVLFTTVRLLDRSRVEPIILLPHVGPICENLEHWGLQYRVWGPLKNYYNPISYFFYLIGYMLKLRREKVDILHFNHANYWRPVEVLAARLLRIPIITHYHVTVSKPGPFVKYSDYIVAVSDFVKDNSKSCGVPIKTVYNSVNIERFSSAKSIRDELGISRDEIVVGFFGQIREIKGIDLFLEMAKRISDPKVRFIIVGECRDPKKFEGSYSEDDLLEEIGDDNRIQYVGYRLDVECLFASTDVVVVPSRWQEPFGLISIEAGAAGLPVVATRVGGIPEVIQDGETGYLVEPGHADQLARRVKDLVKNPYLRKKLGDAGKARVKACFTSQPIRKLENLYERLMG